jgi:signal transduction histidine kinase
VSAPVAVLSAVGAVACVAAAVLVSSRSGRIGDGRHIGALWAAWALVVTITAALLAVAAHLLVGWPDDWFAGFAAGVVAFPLGLALGRVRPLAPRARGVLVATIVNAGLVVLVAGVYVAAVAGFGRTPRPEERSVLWLSVVAAAVAALVAAPARERLEEAANLRVYGEPHSPDEALRTFGGRMSRAVPMDELLLQLVEILRKTMRLDSAEVYTGDRGRFALAVSAPSRPARVMVLEGEALAVATRARAQGNAWLELWVPELLEGRHDRAVRCVMIAHLGELLGMIVVERGRDRTAFGEEEDATLVDLARQVGLALHNVSLDSALEASLDELQRRNDELVASRARIVAAADESRRRIERDLHDGAQQHLVALAVKVGLVKTLLTADPEHSGEILDGLRHDVQDALDELRELAHGIYPPLLRDRGLVEALQAVANRATPPAVLEAGDVGRYAPDVEAALYFCVAEAVQNAGKYAGDGARISIRLGDGDGSLWFEVVDDGAGFDADGSPFGHGFVNMADRLGAFRGRIEVRSAIGEGTVVRGEVPAAHAPLVP